MTSTTIAAVAPTAPTLVAPHSTAAPCRSSVPVVTIRSVDLPPSGNVSGGGVATNGGRLIRRKEFLAETNRTKSLKTLSCDLSEILVKNLSLRRSETSERRPHADTLEELSVTSTGAGSGIDGGAISSGSGSARDSSGGSRTQSALCDTFTSVNKLIRLKRVSSDGSNLSRLSTVVTTNAGGGANYTKILEPAGGKLPPAGSYKRVEISVRERTTASARQSGNDHDQTVSEFGSEESGEESGNEYPTGVVHKSVIVNQLDQVDEHCPLLVVNEDGRAPTITLQKKKTTLVFTRKKVPEDTAPTTGCRSSECDLTSPGSKVLLRRRVRLSGDWLGKGVENGERAELKRRSLQWPIGLATSGSDVAESGRRRSGADTPNKFRHSWNAPGYDILEEDSGVEGTAGDFGKVCSNVVKLMNRLLRIKNPIFNLSHMNHQTEGLSELMLNDFASIVHNLAGLRNHHLANGTHESVSLLEQHSPQIVPSRAARPTSLGGSGQGLRRGPSSWIQSSPMVPTSGVGTGGAGAGGGGGGGGGNGESSPHTGALTGPVPRKRRFEAFLKNLVGRRPSKEPPPAAPPPPPPPLLSSPEIKISKSPSEHNLAEIARGRLNISTTSLSSVHQKLWSVVPLLKRDVSCTSLASPKTTPLLLDSQMASSGDRGLLPIGGRKGSEGGAPVAGLRKCETVLALTNATSQTLEPMRPLNRLRNCASVATCSRCSSLLSLAAAGSRYSLNASNGAFVPVGSGSNDGNDPSEAPKTKKAPADGGSSKRKYVGNLLRLTTTSCSSSASSSASTSGASSPSSSSTPSSSSSGASSPSPNSATGSPAGASVSSKTVMFSTSSPTHLVPVSPINSAATTTTTKALTPTIKFTCKLCLGEFSAENLTRITQCACSFCTE
uniref:Uncharacterized protein n=1 Tax=Anopheles epiroticus TaxID=199890 RepID=A0A182P599_9DIPT